MRIPSVLLPAMLVVGFLLCDNTARAEYMNWSYHWSIGSGRVLASGTGTVSQALGQPGTGATRILAAAVTTNSDATTSNPDRFHSYFDLTLHLTDRATHQSGTLTFQGLISGTLTSNSAHLTESFRTPIEHIKVGNHIYYVELPSHFTLLPPGSPVVRDYYASIWVENVPPPPTSLPQVMTASMMLSGASIAPVGHIGPVPEPSSLVLICLGVVLLSCAAVRRCRLDPSALWRLAH